MILWAGAFLLCLPGTATIGPGGAPCMSVPPPNSSYTVCSMMCVQVSASSSSNIIVYCVLCVLCVHVSLCFYFLLLDTIPVRGRVASSSCTPGTTTIAQTPLYVGAS
jgi:hypothetical protein